MYPDPRTEDKDDLITNSAPLVKRLAYHLIARLPPSVQVDDLIQSGMIGLLDAARQYDAAQGASFETYATIRIRGAMLDELRRNDWAPKSVHKKSRDLTEATRIVENRHGRDARDQEVADQMGIELNDYYQILQETNNAKLFNIEDLNSGEGDGLLESHNTNEPSLESGVTEERFKHHLAEAIDALPERERLVISLYYDDEFNLREIGEVLGVSESRISQIMSQAHHRLRHRLGDWINA